MRLRNGKHTGENLLETSKVEISSGHVSSSSFCSRLYLTSINICSVPHVIVAPIDRVDKVVRALVNEFTFSRVGEMAFNALEKRLFSCFLIKFCVAVWTSSKVESLNSIGHISCISVFLRENTFAQ